MEKRKQLMAANKKKSAERMKKELAAQKARAEVSELKILVCAFELTLAHCTPYSD